MRLRSLAIATSLFSASLAAFASSVTYELSLTDSVTDQVVGTGSFTITGAPSSTPGAVSEYQYYGYPTDGLTAFSFTVDGASFSLATSPIDPTNVIFTGGVLSTIDYAGLLRNGMANIDGLSYQVSASDGGSNGTVSAAAMTPEPSGLLLLSTGVIAVAGLFQRHRPRQLQPRHSSSFGLASPLYALPPPTADGAA